MGLLGQSWARPADGPSASSPAARSAKMCLTSGFYIGKIDVRQQVRRSDLNGFAGPVLGEAGRRPERKQPGGEECQNVSHERILYWEDRCPATSSAFCSY